MAKKIVFWLLIGNFLFISAQLLLPPVTDLFRGSFLFLAPFVLFFLLGGALLVLTLKDKTEGRIRKFLLLTGASAAGVFIGTLLHNMLDALSVVVGEIVILSNIIGFIGALFFIIAIIVCPLGFLVGVVGSIVLFSKNK